jgi:hypothetical protein
MGYGEHAYGLSWYGLADRAGVCSINAGGNIAQQLTASINAAGNIAGPRLSLSLNAGGAIARKDLLSIDAGGYVQGGVTAVLPAGGNISQKLTASIMASATIAGAQSTSINAGGAISESLTFSIDAGGYVLSICRASINAGGRIAPPAGTHILYAGGLIVASPYYYLNGIDITNLMLEGLKPRGPDRKISKKQYPGQEKVLLGDDGYDAKEYSFETLHPNQQAAFDYIEEAMDSDGDMKFYPGDSLWFHKAKFVQVERSKRRGAYYFALSNTVTMAKPWLYLDLAMSWITGSVILPRTSIYIVNAGHYDTPLESLKITGHYLAGFPLGITYAIMDGVNQISSILLADQLLSEEVIELDEDGILTSTYADDFATATRWNRDAQKVGATCSGGKVTVASGGWFYYRFRGPWPCIENIELTAKINIISGSPVIRVSNDGLATQNIVVDTPDIGNNISKKYYMVGTDHYADVYVAFVCPVGASMEVEDVSFVARRRTTGTPTPLLSAGSTRQIKISDGPGSTHSVSVEAVFRERRRSV